LKRRGTLEGAEESIASDSIPPLLKGRLGGVNNTKVPTRTGGGGFPFPLIIVRLKNKDHWSLNKLKFMLLLIMYQGEAKKGG